jgi:hypothetical protein
MKIGFEVPENHEVRIISNFGTLIPNNGHFLHPEKLRVILPLILKFPYV